MEFILDASILMFSLFLRPGVMEFGGKDIYITKPKGSELKTLLGKKVGREEVVLSGIG